MNTQFSAECSALVGGYPSPCGAGLITLAAGAVVSLITVQEATDSSAQELAGFAAGSTSYLTLTEVPQW